MKMINLLKAAPKTTRDIRARLLNKEENRQIALQFGFEYFDGPREQGYGGYQYDGRWVDVAKRLRELYDLTPRSRVLDIGCAKGFLVKDLTDLIPGIDVVGIDVSDYALENCHEEVRGRLMKGSCDNLPFEDDSFDLVLAINTIHNLDEAGCLRSLREIERVSRGKAFVQVDSYRSENERQVFEDWMLTAQTYLTPDGWMDLFQQAGYTGDYFWTILLPEGETLD